MIDLQRDGALWVATLEPPNTVTPEWQARMLEVLDAIEGDCQGEGHEWDLKDLHQAIGKWEH